MSEDYYKILGISRNASKDDIQKAYRDLARKYHPDLNPDDKTAKKKFQQVQTAFDVLNNAEKRELYDRYGSSFESMGAGGPQPGGGPWGHSPGGGPFAGGAENVDFSQFFDERFGAQPGGAGGAGGAGGGGFADFFSQMRQAGGGGRARRPQRKRRGANIQHEMSIPFETSILGGQLQLTIQRQTGKTESITVKIPPGIEDGKKIRLKGQGEPTPQGGTAGDILLTVRVGLHPFFERRGEHLYVKVPITVGEAVLGAKVDVPTPNGTVALSIPPCASSGTKLRIKGLGVPTKTGGVGDLFAEVQIVLPKKIDDKSRATIEKFAKNNSQDPRADLKW